ncbi:hypothetical protein D3C78_952160 [compost metagenome]
MNPQQKPKAIDAAPSSLEKINVIESMLVAHTACALSRVHAFPMDGHRLIKLTLRP